jgi:hypothetical protein
VRTAAATIPDQSTVYVTFLDGNGATISATSAVAKNVADRWELIGDRVAVPVGTRRIKYRFETVLTSGASNDGHLDAGFLYVVPESFAPNQGAWGNTADEDAQSTATHIALRSPDLYADWERDKPHAIRWETYNNAANALVRIDLYKDTADGPALFQTISAGAADTGSFVWTPSANGIDYGTYRTFDPVLLSGTVGVGDDEGFTLTGPIGEGRTAAVRFANVLTVAPLLDLNAADFMTVSNLTLSGGQYGLYAHNQSTHLTARNVTANANSLDGVRVQGGSDGAALEGVTAIGNGRFGVYASGPIDHLTGSTVSLNHSTGIDLEQPGAVRVENNTVTSNLGIGVYVYNPGNLGQAVVGNADVAQGKGNVVAGNAGHGIEGYGNVLVAGNTISGSAAFNDAGIYLTSGGAASANVVFDNYTGISSDSGAPIANNRVYHNANVGIDARLGTVSGNVVYSNAVGITTANGSLRNNLVYANGTQGVLVTGSGAQVVNNTVYQTAGDAVHLADNLNGVQLRNNVLWAAGAGFAVNVPTSSQVGFGSDYNLLYATGAGRVGNWQGAARQTLPAWQAASSGDDNSLSLDPRFVNTARADGILGWGQISDGSDDNFHIQSLYGSVKGAASGYPTPSGTPVVSGGTGLPYFPAGTVSADAAQSPAIDRGSATDGFANEPAPNGSFVNLGWDGNTPLASLSPSQYVLVIKPAGGETWPIGQTFPICWRSQDTAGTVTIDLLRVGNPTPVLTVAAGVANSGQYNWSIPGNLAPASDYLIRVTRADLPGVPGVSTAPFSVAVQTKVYYVNDATVQDGDWTRAAGDDVNNDGLTPDTPKASVGAVLAAYQLGMGDVIRVDAGTYALTTNVVITGDDAGVSIQGYNDPAHPDRRAVLDRGNTSDGSYVFDVQGAGHVTLDHLGITGGYIGVHAGNGANSTDLTVSNSDVTDYYEGIDLEPSNVRASITGNTVHDDANNNGGNAGLVLNAEHATVSNNVFFNVNLGINASVGAATITGNTAYGNRYAGIVMSGGAGAGVVISNNVVTGNGVLGIYGIYNVLVVGNTAYGQLTGTGIQMYGGEARGNTVFDNRTGIDAFAGEALVRDNRVYHNSGTGIAVSGGTILGNTVYSNDVGIQGYSRATFRNNLVYANASLGVSLVSGQGGVFDSNTVYQTAGDALRLAGNISNFTVRNNILASSGASVENVAADSEAGYVSDCNDLRATGPAALLLWGGKAYAARSDLFYDLGLEAHGQTADPQFVQLGARTACSASAPPRPARRRSSMTATPTTAKRATGPPSRPVATRAITARRSPATPAP